MQVKRMQKKKSFLCPMTKPQWKRSPFKLSCAPCMDEQDMLMCISERRSVLLFCMSLCFVSCYK